MARIKTLASSSSGNSTYIGSSGQGILVDCGISNKRIVTALDHMSCDPRHIGAVLITHEHIDHIKGLKIFLKVSQAAVCATAPVLEFLIKNDMISSGTKMIEVGDTPFEVCGMEVCGFYTPHDSVGSVGYRIHTSDDHKIAIATDIGIVTDEIIKGTLGCQTVMLEANYEPQLLKMGSYPAFLKNRITSTVGHLSNGESGEIAVKLLENGTVRIVLGHLSKENNTPSLAFQTVTQMLSENGAVENEDYILTVAPYDKESELISI